MILLLLALLGCAARLGPPKVEHGAATALPIVHPDNDPDRWYVVVDGEPFGQRLFFFDTGYSYTTCDDDFVRELGLAQRGRIVVHGEAGDIVAKKAVLPDFTIGTHRVSGLVCLVRDLATTSSIDDPAEVRVAGVIGADLLREFDLIVDPTGPNVGLHDPNAREPIRRRDDDVIVMRREYWVGLRFAVPVSIDGRWVWPIVDTGANGTHVDGESLGLKPVLKQDGVRVRASGANGGSVRDLVYYRAETVQLGRHPVGPVMLTDRERAPWVPGLLGLNVLQYYLQEYDFQKGTVRVVPVEPADVPSFNEYSQGL